MPAPKRSKIGYCDYSGGDLNICIGCTPVSAGCTNCYARRIYDRFGKDFSKVTIYPDKLERLLKWQPKPPYKRGPGSKPLAFVVDMGDLFHPSVPSHIIQEFLDVVVLRHDIDWLMLTKRPRRMRDEIYLWRFETYLKEYQRDAEPEPNLWLGVTVENEDSLWRIDELLKTPAAVRWVSYEPALGPIDIGSYLCTRPEDGQMRQPKGREASQPKIHKRADSRDSFASGGGLSQAEGVSREISRQPVNNFGHSHQANLDTYFIGISWVCIGAESGPNCRPFKKEWAWDVLDQCREAGVPCFLKQDSGAYPGVPLLDREGREVKEWPEPPAGENPAPRQPYPNRVRLHPEEKQNDSG